VAGFDFGQVQIAQKKCAERPEQGSGHVFVETSDFPGHALSRPLWIAADVPGRRRKSREVLTVIFNRRRRIVAP
jgi:hypothetical protein